MPLRYFLNVTQVLLRTALARALPAAFLLCLALPGETRENKRPVVVEEHEMELDWEPTISMSALTRGMPDLPDTRVTVRGFRDLRPAPQRVADVQIGPQYVHIFVAENNATNWVANNFISSLDNAGVHIGSDGEVVLSGEITHFLATKSPNYNGDVSIRITLERGDKIMWRGTVSGWATRGGDYGIGDEDEYNEVLSDAIMRAAASLAWYPKFRAALKGDL